MHLYSFIIFFASMQWMMMTTTISMTTTSIYGSFAIGVSNDFHYESCEGFGSTSGVGVVVDLLIAVAKDLEYKDDNRE